MAESFIQLPTDQAGKKQRHRERVIGANTVYEVAMSLGANPSYYAFADAVTGAVNKHHISILNATGSGVTLRLRKLFCINVATSAQSGGLCRFDIKRATAHSVGTTITPEAVATDNAALPAGVTVRTNGTVTEGSLLFPWNTYTDEDTAVVGLSKGIFQQSVNVLMESVEFQEVTLRAANEGLTVKQITSTAGLMGWLLVFSVDS